MRAATGNASPLAAIARPVGARTGKLVARWMLTTSCVSAGTLVTRGRTCVGMVEEGGRLGQWLMWMGQGGKGGMGSSTAEFRATRGPAVGKTRAW